MIDQSQFTWAIIAMAAVTFTVRYSFLMRSLSFRLHPQIKNILTFTAPCVLTALFIPIMFKDMIAAIEPNQILQHMQWSLVSLFTSSYFWASIVCVILSCIVRNTLLVILISISVFYVLRYVFL